MRRLLLVLVLAAAAYAAWQLLTFPDVARLSKEFPKSTAFMDQRRAELRREGKDDTLSYNPVSYGRISPYFRRGVLVAEDSSFYEHEGVDMEAMRQALERDLKRRRITHGGSTITQQLAKNLYLSPSRNPIRKVKEYFITRALEKHLSKKRILELYMNVVEMGERVYGAEAAAHFYFHKSAAALNPREAALLAGCLPNPRLMNPGEPNKRLRARQRMILGRMRRWGYVYETEVLTEKKPGPKATEPAAATTAEPPQTDTVEPVPPETTTAAEDEPVPETTTSTDTAAPSTSTETVPPSATDTKPPAAE